jgi:septum formation inhibitor MinC
MPNKLRPILLALFLAATAGGVLGCGGDNGPAPSIPAANASLLRSKIAEINANIQNGSCIVAGEKTDDLIADVHALPSSVNDKVVQALENGANNLKLLTANQDQCQGNAQTTTSTPSTTESTTQSTTTTRTRPTTTTTTPTQTQQTTTQTQTQTTPTPTTGGSGGIGPGGL